jgi:hypothetical protein
MATDNFQSALATSDTKTEVAMATEGAGGNLREAYKMAKVFANSQLVPAHLRNKPDDCFIALVMAEQLRENPLMVMQNIVIVQGTAGWKAQFVIARANRVGPFKDPITFHTEGKGESLSVTARATIASTGTVVERTVTMAMAKAAGWTKNSKYQEIPEQMLSYRAATFLVRLYCPEVMMGFQTEDEVRDLSSSRGIPNTIQASGAIDAINSAIVDVTPPADAPTDAELAAADREVVS